METTFEQTYLIQRLQKPLVIEGKNKDSVLAKLVIDNPFAFGGGGGGLSKEAMDILRDVLRFDYMGSAEFEFGAVPEALQTIIKSKTLIATEISVKARLSEYWYKKDKCGRRTDKERPFETKTVYVICPKEMLDHVTTTVKMCATNEISLGLKEACRLDRGLFPENAYDPVGWLELDNGFMFFADKEMFENMCKIFQVEVSTNA